MRCHQANLIRFTQTRQKSRFNGIMSARSTGPAHLFVVEREEEEGQTTSFGWISIWEHYLSTAFNRNGRPPFSMTFPHESFLTPLVSP